MDAGTGSGHYRERQQAGRVCRVAQRRDGAGGSEQAGCCDRSMGSKIVRWRACWRQGRRCACGRRRVTVGSVAGLGARSGATVGWIRRCCWRLMAWRWGEGDKATTRALSQITNLCCRGHGHSNFDERPIGYSLMAEDVLALMDHLSTDKADLVGWSDGGIIGLDLAINHPERLNRVVAFGANYNPSGGRPVIGENEKFDAYIDEAAGQYQQARGTLPSGRSPRSSTRTSWISWQSNADSPGSSQAGSASILAGRPCLAPLPPGMAALPGRCSHGQAGSASILAGRPCLSPAAARDDGAPRAVLSHGQAGSASILAGRPCLAPLPPGMAALPGRCSHAVAKPGAPASLLAGLASARLPPGMTALPGQCSHRGSQAGSASILAGRPCLSPAAARDDGAPRAVLSRGSQAGSASILAGRPCLAPLPPGMAALPGRCSHAVAKPGAPASLLAGLASARLPPGMTALPGQCSPRGSQAGSASILAGRPCLAPLPPGMAALPGQCSHAVAKPGAPASLLAGLA